jgi:DNA-directed RNA polymerase specialized sigma24 family protein
MSTTNSISPLSDSRQAAFRTTRWSVVLSAQRQSSEDAAQSLEMLCQQYWPPLFAYVRHRGYSEHDAQDLTQSFFTRLLEKDCLAAVDREQGRFRSFLLMAMKRFLANEWDRLSAQKRGGGTKIISMDSLERMPNAEASTIKVLRRC